MNKLLFAVLFIWLTGSYCVFAEGDMNTDPLDGTDAVDDGTAATQTAPLPSYPKCPIVYGRSDTKTHHFSAAELISRNFKLAPLTPSDNTLNQQLGVAAANWFFNHPFAINTYGGSAVAYEGFIVSAYRPRQPNDALTDILTSNNGINGTISISFEKVWLESATRGTTVLNSFSVLLRVVDRRIAGAATKPSDDPRYYFSELDKDMQPQTNVSYQECKPYYSKVEERSDGNIVFRYEGSCSWARGGMANVCIFPYLDPALTETDSQGRRTGILCISNDEAAENGNNEQF